jgi:hypothetical protein
VFNGESLNGRPHGHLFFHGLVCLQRPIETRSADLRQITHPLDTQLVLLDITSRMWASMPSPTVAAPLASSLYCAQGTGEKICLQRLVRQGPFQSADLLAERRLTGIRRGPFVPFRRFQLIALRIQQPPMDTYLLRQFHNVVVLFQSCDRILSKRLRKLAYALLGHLPPSWSKCADVGCLKLGVQSRILDRVGVGEKVRARELRSQPVQPSAFITTVGGSARTN